MGTSEDHDGSQTETGGHANDPLAIGGPFDDDDTGSEAEAMPTETSGDPLSDSRMVAMGAALTEGIYIYPGSSAKEI